jgi:two-component system nitrogen regulation sensor histidine kinase NtrY
MGEIAFLDRKGGGTHVRIAFDAERLAKLASEASGDEGEDGDEPHGGPNSGADNPEESG